MVVALVLAMILARARPSRPASSARSSTCPDITPPVAIGIMILVLFNGSTGIVNRGARVHRDPGPVLDDRPDLDQAEPRDHEHLDRRRDDGHLPRRAEGRAAAPLRGGRDGRRRAVAALLQRHAADDQPGALLHVHRAHDRRPADLHARSYTAFFGAGATGAEAPDAALMNVVYLFRQAFEFFNMGFASAMAWLLFAIIMVVTGDPVHRQPPLRLLPGVAK